ncbi:TonB-dependent receptor [Treponema sp. OttesenSCG-928-L16]|nr:TonB-dependent receptor [Treponema sp. OttesenSCG-928-L16]
MRAGFSKLKKWLPVFSLVLLLPSLPSAAADSGGGAELSYTVSAGRIAEESDTVPALITVISAEDIAESGTSSAVQVLEQVPGIIFRDSMYGPGSQEISMRGFGENSFGRVLVLIDGRKLNNPDMKGINWNAVALSDIERIEVLDGSAGVQYGNNAVAGVINIITKKTGPSRTAALLSGGSFFENREQLSHYGRTGWGSFSFAAEHIGTEGYRDRQASRTVNASARVSFDLSERLVLSLDASMADLDYQMPGDLTKAEYDDDPRQASEWDDEASEHHFSGNAELLWLLGDSAEIRLPLSYTGKFISTDMASQGSYSDRKVHTGEARPQGSLNLDIGGFPLRLLGGVDLYFAHLENTSYGDKQRDTNPSNEFTVYEFSAGPYLTARFEPLPDRIYLNAGLRFDTALIGAENIDASVDEKITHHAFVYDAGITYRPLENFKVYAKYAALFRYPFTDEQASLYGYGTDGFNTDLDPEQGFNAEGGIRFSLKDVFAIQGSVYYMRLRDEIAYNSVTWENENMDRTQRVGVNVSAEATPLSWLEFQGSYTFVHAAFVNGDHKDKQIPLVPAHNAHVSAAVTLPLGFTLGSGIDYRGASYEGGDYSNAKEMTDAYILWGAFVRFAREREGRRLSLQLTGKNLLDTKYASSVYYGSYYPGDGRSVSLSAGYTF